MKTYKHLHAILKEGKLVIEANEEKKPTEVVNLSRTKLSKKENNILIDSLWAYWQQSCEYIEFIDKHNENACMFYLSKEPRPTGDYLRKGIDVYDCVEIKQTHSLLRNPSIPVYKAFFKNPTEKKEESQDDEPVLFLEWIYANCSSYSDINTITWHFIPLGKYLNSQELYEQFKITKISLNTKIR